jgi:hypothetical protein
MFENQSEKNRMNEKKEKNKNKEESSDSSSISGTLSPKSSSSSDLKDSHPGAMFVGRKQTEISELSQIEKTVVIDDVEISLPFTKEIKRDLFEGNDN